MDLSRRLRSTALIFLIYTVLVPLSSARFHESRHKRQNGARMYLPESFIIPGDEGDPGDWSDWSSPSECSRSCGGGVSYQTRECLRIESNGVASCSGGNRKYFSCNTQDCPEEEPDFRSQQCSRFDNVPFDGVYYNWVPYTNAPNPCELNCMPVGERFYFHQKAKVIDGTRCNDKVLDVCVDGVCQPVGCDMMLGSDAKEDKCRKCGGDGSTCKTISDTLTTNNLAAGYNDILLIPSGATNIRIQETAPSNNYLACRNLSSHYYLNGNWRIDFPRPMFYAGSWWNYQRKPTGFAAPDYLTASGPITESIYIVMLVQDRNVSINYEYSIPASVIQNTPDVYSWTHMEFEPCSASCGGGTQSRTVTCNNRISLDEVDSSLCDSKTKPAETQECGQEPCAPSWIDGEWGKCSKGCGEDGFQNRIVTCERISPNGDHTVEEDAVCLQLVGNKPATTMECNRDVENCPKYHLGPWKPCDRLCGEGKQIRKVTCYIEENGRKKILPETECMEEKPETEKSCMLTPCEGVDWIISQWSGCDACGQNTETRSAICGSKLGTVYPEEFCGPEVPLLVKPCKSPKCPTQWFASEWSKCSAACGKGVQSRVVLCGIFNGKSVTTAPNDSECEASSKPEAEQECEGEEKECPGEWFTGPWEACSEPCGGGERVREVLCLANGTKSSNCDQSKLEFASEKCNTHACTDDEVIPVDSTATPLDSEEDSEDEDDCDEDTSEFDVEFVTDKMSADLKISEGISLDEETTTSSSLITDELMLSDAPSSDETEFDLSSTDISLSTIEGSGESTDSTDETSMGVSEGSGDETDATTESSDSTSGYSTDSASSEASSESTAAATSSSAEVSTDLTEESDATSSSTVEADSSTMSTDESETSEESSDTTSKKSTTDSLSTIETTETSSDTTNGDSTTDAISTDASTDISTGVTSISDSTTDATESTLISSGSTEISSESTSSDSSLSTEDTTLENTKSTDLSTTDASSSSESSSLETLDSTLVSSESTESTLSSSTDASISTEADTSKSTDISISTESDTTESTDSSSRDTSISTQSDTTESTVSLSTDTSKSTESDTTESTESSSTDSSISTESDTTESTDTSSTDTSSSTESDTTESIDTSSTDTSLSTDSDTVITQLTSDVTSSSSDSSSDSTTVDTTSTESSSSSSLETSESSSSSSETTQVSGETTPSSTDSSDVSTELSSETTLFSSSTDSTDKTTESIETTDTSDSTDLTTISSSVESESTEQETTSSSDSTYTTDISESTSLSFESSTEGITTDISSSESTSVTDETSLTTSSTDSSELTTDLSESTTDLSELTTDLSTGVSGSSTDLSTDSSTDSSTDLSTDSSTDLSTESSDLATESSIITTDSSESTSDSSDLTTDSSETTEFSTESFTTDSSSSSESSLSTDETTVDFWSSTNTDETEETSERSTPNTLQSVFTKETTPRKCKAKKTQKDCNKKPFGCCPDKITAAKGPFDKGCPIAKTCAETEFGCCLDGVSPAQDKNLKGCPSSQCAETLFGCCPDKYTAAEGEDNEGCPEPTTLPPTTTTDEVTDTSETTDSSTIETEDTSTETTTEQEDIVKSCSFAEFGCCPDGTTEAKGDNFLGCDNVIDSKDCSKSIHGCCDDGRTSATGPDGQGCASCTKEPFGCCQDNQTPAHGPLGEGCCLKSAFGCCPDNINFAYGPNFEGCDCAHTPYGCCPDKKQAARGYNNEGCSCETLKFGCCPDKITPATGPKFEGCACHTMQYGCCPDGTTLAQGPHHYGCHCSQSEFKCCQDEKTSAKGPNYEGCTCLESKFGCCPDGVTSAEGEKFEGCENVREPLQKACGLPKETGNCSSFAIKFFFDTSYGACARFWYGGCGGNDNKFETEAHCKETCQEYMGKDACLLPKSSGPCTGYNKKWYFNSDRNRCEEFNYGGCYGTSNRFDSIEECQALCAVSESIPPCEQPMDVGPCEGNFERWFYDNETDVCHPFRYGGCKGNKNNYPTEHSCNYNCRQPGVHKDYCSLPKQTGDCSEQHARWHYSESDKKCMPFYYSGCGGNKNSFRSLESCEDHCPKEVAKDVCEIPAEVGECQNYASMWYYDTKDERCRQFYYGGCGGNGNKFQTEAECLQRCEHKPEETPEPEPEKPTPNQSAAPAASPPTGDICTEQPDVGSCRNFTLEWYFDADNSRCRQFYYGGCEGNDNRFSTEEECAQRCSTLQAPVAVPPAAPPVAPQEENSICESPADVGSCEDYVIMWFFNANESQCQQFYYGGCDGNENRFQTEQECSQRCSEPKTDIDTRFGASSEVETPPDNNVAPNDEEKCFLVPVSGDCNNNVTRWFYNSAEGLCDEFLYGGCGGNGNNFESEDACHNSCYHVQTTCSLPPVPGRCDDNSTRWYFDERAGSCYEFEFSGCRGNRNNFVTEAECMDFCAAQPNQPEKSPEPAAPAYSLCDLPVEAGECENNTLAWFYDTETMSCTAFTYTGCGGNGNRFESKEQCDRQCGEFRGIDVCNEPVQTGPCRQWQTRFYFNKASRSCEPFTYGGCDGTGNRFVLRAECESLCIVGQEPQTTANKDICKIPVNSGKCEGQSIYERRWYYDDERGTCISFIYAGCAGNQNNFRSYESCVNFCTNPEEPNERTNEVIPDRCESYEEECRQLRCQYGVQRTAIEDNCTRCACENPCEQHSCPEGQQCAVDVTSDTSRQFEPVCRAINKPGECPHFTSSSTNCARECYTDADCRGDNKCCADGCGFVCVRPTEPTQATTRPTTPLPAVIYPGEVQVSLEPKKPQELDVQTSVGGIAVLRCFATGIPAPNVTWSRHNVVIDTNQGRYVLTSSGDLTIVQVRQTDTGSYVCVADNGLGAPVQREVQLQVTEPQNIPAYIFGDKNVTQIVTLNSPALVRCPAGGHPAPQVSWWRNRKRLGLIGDRYEMTRDYALMFHAVQLSDLGLYTCEVYNHRRRPVSMKITLKAVGPARAVNRNDAPFLQYVIDPATAPITPRPAYPYRPTRPYVPPPPPVVVVETRQPQLVIARAVLVRDPRNTYSLGSPVLLACEVQGYPAPNVTWTKDGVPLSAGERIQITADPHRLVINEATTDDTGLYGCTARNSFSYNTSEEKVAIESVIPVHPDCVDNRYFANCKLIVKGNYCTHQYYAKFCCRSCTLAGQLGGVHPNAV